MKKIEKYIIGVAVMAFVSLMLRWDLHIVHTDGAPKGFLLDRWTGSVKALISDEWYHVRESK